MRATYLKHPLHTKPLNNPRWVLLLALWLISITLAAVSSAPITAKKPVTDRYHGLEVIDDYRWLENFEDPAVREWNRTQNAHTRAYLDSIPARREIHDRLQKLYGAASASYFDLQYRRGTVFALKRQPPLEQPLLVTLASLDDLGTEKVLVDPNALNAQGTTAINLHMPSHDGRLAAVSLTESGSEEGTLYVYEVSTGKRLPDVIPRAVYPTGGGSVAWNADGTGFYYTRYPRAGERPEEELNFYEQVYFHKLGQPESQDTYVIGKHFPKIAEVFLETRPESNHLLVTVQNGDGGDFAHFLRDSSGQWTQLSKFSDGVKAVTFGPNQDLFVFSKHDAPRGKILRWPLDQVGKTHARLFVPESEAVIEGYDWRGMSIVPSFLPAQSILYVLDLAGGPSQIRAFDQPKKLKLRVPILPVSAVGQMLPLGGNEILFLNESFVDPPAWFRFSPSEPSPVRTALYQTSPVRYDDTEVERHLAASKDGTRIPLTLIYRKGTPRHGNNPALLTGYGGYGVSITPRFLSLRSRLWLDQGGILAVANLRGGGEFGEEWHKAGNLTRKQNVFDDFIACAEFLIEQRWTRPAKLAIEGGSNGGLLMGAALTQRPDLFRAVVAHVGIYDMLRVELEPNGAFNVPEFGTVQDPDQFTALYAYSPFHRVIDGTQYPAVLLSTGENDRRVNPFNSRKMAARLQAATGSSRPVLLRTSSSSGHGAGTALSERIAEQADVLAFFFDQLGVVPQDENAIP